MGALTTVLATVLVVLALAAGFAAPFVGATAALTKASAELFEELPSDFNVQPPSQISTLLASDGSEITKFYAENRIVVPLSSISVNMQNAIVAVEDQRGQVGAGAEGVGGVAAAAGVDGVAQLAEGVDVAAEGAQADARLLSQHEPADGPAMAAQSLEKIEETFGTRHGVSL